MSGILTYLQNAAIRDQVTTLQGEILTAPLLQKTDGTNLTYSCTVKISTDDPRGNPWWDGTGSQPIDTTIDPCLFGAQRVLYNVPLAVANRDLIYAQAGAAVILSRSESGRFEVTGFSKVKPGTWKRVGVNLDTLQSGAVEDLSITARPLTYEEIGSYGSGYGSIPYGAAGLFAGGVLVRISGGSSLITP